MTYEQLERRAIDLADSVRHAMRSYIVSGNREMLDLALLHDLYLDAVDLDLDLRYPNQDLGDSQESGLPKECHGSITPRR